MLVHPQIDPVALTLGPLSIHWYGLMYLLGFVLFIILGRYRIKRTPQSKFTNEMLDDALFYGALGVIIGVASVMCYFISSGIICSIHWKYLRYGKAACRFMVDLSVP